MEPESSVHGESGPLEVTAPADTTETRELFFKAMNEFGVKTVPDCVSTRASVRDVYRRRPRQTGTMLVPGTASRPSNP
jgi:hypothetical protein